MLSATRPTLLQRSSSLPNLVNSLADRKHYPRSLENFSSEAMALHNQLIQNVKRYECDITVGELEKIIRFAKEQFERIKSNILYQIPKGFDGLARTLFINGDQKTLFVPLKKQLVNRGLQNEVKKGILIQMTPAPSVRLIAKISRRLGFLDSEKLEHPDWQIRKELNAAMAQHEITTLKRLNAKSNVLQVIDSCLYLGTKKQESVDKMVLFTELFSSNLFQACYEHRLGVLSEREKIEIVNQIAKGLAATHGEQIVHKDIKLENVLISRSEHLAVVLADYGHSRPLGVVHEGLDGRGSYFAWPPEVLEGIINHGNLSLPSNYGVDLWAFGVLIHEMFLGDVEWMGAIEQIKNIFLVNYRREKFLDPNDPLIEEKKKSIDDQKLLMQIEFQKFTEKVKALEEEAIDTKNVMMLIIQRLLRYDSSKRISAKEVVALLEGYRM